MDTMTAQGAPSKTRDIQNHHMDSTIWDSFTFRDDDIIVASYAKAGTTWTQQIVGQLIFDGRTEPAAGQVSPWVDLRVPPPEVKLPMLEAQTHRRFLKTHLPVDALVFSPKVKYVYVARDGRDLMWSLHNHHYNANDQFFPSSTTRRAASALRWTARPKIRSPTSANGLMGMAIRSGPFGRTCVAGGRSATCPMC